MVTFAAADKDASELSGTVPIRSLFSHRGFSAPLRNIVLIQDSFGPGAGIHSPTTRLRKLVASSDLTVP